jgi:RNA polymerase sigma-70 factor (ECF subfamily)
MLSRRVGMQHLENVEDAVQSALMKAFEAWTRAGSPDNPSAWLSRVALNEVTDRLRKESRRQRLVTQHDSDDDCEQGPAEAPFLGGEVGDDLLRLLFVCCEPAIPVESQLVLALKVLSGFDVREIALRLFISEASAYKRLSRARQILRELSPSLDEVLPDDYAERVPRVHKILYLIFTEGYLSSQAEEVIRRDLCDEAIRLATVLVRHPAGDAPETRALLALMHLHVARIAGRQDESGVLLLLAEQDRTVWDAAEIQTGLSWLASSAEGDVYSRYHAEAAIAAEHCLAPSFAATRWEKIVESYDLLERLAPSPLHRLNRAVALSQCQGPTAGLAVLEGFEPPTWLSGSYLWAAVLADLHHRAGNEELFATHQRAALELAPTPAVAELLRRRFARCESS